MHNKTNAILKSFGSWKLCEDIFTLKDSVVKIVKEMRKIAIKEKLNI